MSPKKQREKAAKLLEKSIAHGVLCNANGEYEFLHPQIPLPLLFNLPEGKPLFLRDAQERSPWDRKFASPRKCNVWIPSESFNKDRKTQENLMCPGQRITSTRTIATLLIVCFLANQNRLLRKTYVRSDSDIVGYFGRDGFGIYLDTVGGAGPYVGIAFESKNLESSGRLVHPDAA